MNLTSNDMIQFIKDDLNVDEDIHAGTALFSTGLLDSVAMMNVIGFVEERTKIEVRPGDVTLENFDTPERIEAYVASHE